MSYKRSVVPVIVVGVAAGLRRPEIAEKAGISERTLRRRLRDPDVIQGILEARVQLHAETMGRLQALSVGAIEQIEGVLAEGNHKHKLDAAKLILDQIVSHRGALDDARVSALRWRTPNSARG